MWFGVGYVCEIDDGCVVGKDLEVPWRRLAASYSVERYDQSIGRRWGSVKAYWRHKKGRDRIVGYGRKSTWTRQGRYFTDFEYDGLDPHVLGKGNVYDHL